MTLLAVRTDDVASFGQVGDSIVLRTRADIPARPVFEVVVDVDEYPMYGVQNLDEGLSLLKKAVVDKLYTSPKDAEEIRRGTLYKRLLESVMPLSNEEIRDLVESMDEETMGRRVDHVRAGTLVDGGKWRGPEIPLQDGRMFEVTSTSEDWWTHWPTIVHQVDSSDVPLGGAFVVRYSDDDDAIATLTRTR